MAKVTVYANSFEINKCHCICIKHCTFYYYSHWYYIIIIISLISKFHPYKTLIVENILKAVFKKGSFLWTKIGKLAFKFKKKRKKIKKRKKQKRNFWFQFFKVKCLKKRNKDLSTFPMFPHLHPCKYFKISLSNIIIGYVWIL